MTTRLRSCGKLFLIVLALAGLLGPSALSAQTFEAPVQVGADLLELRMADGSILFGRIVAVDGDRITFETTGGARLQVTRLQITLLRRAEGQVRDGSYWFEDPNSSRLFFFSTGRTLDKGEAYLGTYLIILPFASVGVTDRFTIGGGAPITLGSLQPFYVMPKLALVRSENTNVSIGTLHILLPDDPGVGIAYGVGTFGGNDRALTLGLGFGYAGDELAEEPVGMIGGEVRFARTAKFITENYILPDIGVVIGAGVRFMSNRLSADAGIGAIVAGDDAACCLPLLNFSYSFGPGS